MIYRQGQLPFVAGSDTSEAAADSMETDAPRLRSMVYAAIHQAGLRGRTCDELEVLLALRHQTASARVRELVLGNAVTDSGRRRRTRSGRFAVVWEVLPRV